MKDAHDMQDFLEKTLTLPTAQQFKILQGLVESLAHRFSQSDFRTGQRDGVRVEGLEGNFWTPRSLDELACARYIPVVDDIQTLADADWPEDETADDLIAFVRSQRAADRIRE